MNQTNQTNQTNTDDRLTASVTDALTRKLSARVLAEIVSDPEFTEYVDRVVSRKIASAPNVGPSKIATGIRTKPEVIRVPARFPLSLEAAPQKPLNSPIPRHTSANRSPSPVTVSHMNPERTHVRTVTFAQPIISTATPAVSATPAPKPIYNRSGEFSGDEYSRKRGWVCLAWCKPYSPGPSTPHWFADLMFKIGADLQTGVLIEHYVFSSKKRDTTVAQAAEAVGYGPNSQLRAMWRNTEERNAFFQKLFNASELEFKPKLGGGTYMWLFRHAMVRAHNL
jgi:hypothetical protein